MSSLSSGGKGHYMKEWFIILHCTQELRAGLRITTLKCHRASEQKQHSAQGMTGETEW